MKFNVHIFPIVRIVISNVEASSQSEAIKQTEKGLSLERVLTQGAVGVEYADEISHYLVDQVGDEDHEHSQFYEADGVTPLVNETTRKRIVATVKGGRIEHIITAIPGVECLIIDHDADGVNLEELRNCPVCDLDCYSDIVDTQFDPKLVEDCFTHADTPEDKYKRAVKLIQTVLYTERDETGKPVINPDKSWSPDSLDEIAAIINQTIPLEKEHE